MSEKFSGGRRVLSQVASELREAIIVLAGERAAFDSRQRWLERAARSAGISPRMAKALFYGEAQDPKTSVVESVRSAVKKKQRENADLISITRDEFGDLVSRLGEMERTIADLRSDLARAKGNLDS